MDARTIYNRKRKLMSIQRKISAKRNRKMIGQEVDVLIEGPSKESDLLWEARMSTQAPEIDGVCYISDPGEGPIASGQMRRMRITEAHDYDLVGALVDESHHIPSTPVAMFPILTGHKTPNHLPHR